MKKRTTGSRVFCWLLAVVLATSCLFGAGCGKKGDSGDTDPSNPSAVTTNPTPDEENPDEEARFKPAPKDFGDGISGGVYEYKMLVNTNYLYQNTYVYDGEGTPTAVCDYALFLRKHFMKEQYNINLSITKKDDNEILTMLEAAVKGGDADICETVFMNGINTMTAARNGYLLNLNKMDELNLEASYWDQRIQKEYVINDYLFCLEGDFGFIDDFRTYVTIYNKTMYEDNGNIDKYDTPYKMVSSGKWTYGTMKEMIKDLGDDLNGDNKMDEQDCYGLVAEFSAPYYFFLGSGMKYVSNQNGELTFNAANEAVWENAITALQEYLEMGQSKDVIFPDRDIKTSDVWGDASAIFMNDRALFRCTSLSAVTRLLDMDSPYGILPIPKYTEGQDGYYCWVSPFNHNPLAIPVTVRDSSKTALATEYLCYHSRYGGDSLNHAFYDLLAYAKLCHTVDDKNMLKLVFANKTFDVDGVTHVMGIENITMEIIRDSAYTQLASKLASARDGVTSRIQQVTLDIVNKVPNP